MTWVLLLIAFASMAAAILQESMTSFEVSPNPMDHMTTVFLTLSQKVIVTVTVENNTGAVIKTLYSGDLNAGSYQIPWDRFSDAGVYMPNGKYAVNVTYSGKYTSTKKTLILK